MSTSRQPGGRPRESRVDDAVGVAVRELLAEQGYAALTVGAVAQRARVGKAAIYRRYATKQEMLFAILLHGLQEEPPPDTGSLRGDLEALTARVADSLVRTSAEVMAGLLADIHDDDTLGERFEQTYLADERATIALILDRAVARHELSESPDPEIVHALVHGPLFAWLIMLAEDPERAPELARTVARMVAGSLVAAVPESSARGKP